MNIFTRFLVLVFFSLNVFLNVSIAQTHPVVAGLGVFKLGMHKDESLTYLSQYDSIEVKYYTDIDSFINSKEYICSYKYLVNKSKIKNWGDVYSERISIIKFKDFTINNKYTLNSISLYFLDDSLYEISTGHISDTLVRDLESI